MCVFVCAFRTQRVDDERRVKAETRRSTRIAMPNKTSSNAFYWILRNQWAHTAMKQSISSFARNAKHLNTPPLLYPWVNNRKRNQLIEVVESETILFFCSLLLVCSLVWLKLEQWHCSFSRVNHTIFRLCWRNCYITTTPDEILLSWMLQMYANVAYASQIVNKALTLSLLGARAQYNII